MDRPRGVYSTLPVAFLVVLAVVAPLGFAMTGVTGLTWVVPGAVIWTSLFAFAAARAGRSVFAWALAGGLICGTIWALGEVFAHHIISSGIPLSIAVPVAVLCAGLGGGGLIGVTLGPGQGRSDDVRLSLAAALLGAGLGAAAGVYFATSPSPSAHSPAAAPLVAAGMLGGLIAALPGRAVGLRFRPAVLFFEDLWPYLSEMAVPLAAFGVGYACLTVAFAGFYGTVWRLDRSAFEGLPVHTGFWDFVFFSLMTASSANTSVSAVSGAAQVLVALEVTLGLGWLIVVFGALSAHLAPRLSQIAEGLHRRR